MVVEGACLLIVLIGRLGRHGAGLVGMLNEVPAAVGHMFGPLAAQCKSQAPPGPLEEDVLAHPMADVEELEMQMHNAFFNPLGFLFFWHNPEPPPQCLALLQGPVIFGFARPNSFL